MMRLAWSDNLGAISLANASNSSSVSLLSRLYITEVARSSKPPTSVNRTMVLAKVGKSGQETISSISANSFCIPSSIKGRKRAALVWFVDSVSFSAKPCIKAFCQSWSLSICELIKSYFMNQGEFKVTFLFRQTFFLY